MRLRCLSRRDSLVEGDDMVVLLGVGCNGVL